MTNSASGWVARRLWQYRGQQLDILDDRLGKHRGHARDVLAGVREADRESVAHRIGFGRRDDRKGRRGLQCCAIGLRPVGEDQLDIRPHEFGYQPRQASGIAVRKTLFDDKVAVLFVAMVAQAQQQAVLIATVDKELL